MRIKRQQNMYVKSGLEKLRAGGDMVSDQEMQGVENQARDAAQQAIGGQQAVLNRAAMANNAGNPVLAGALKDSAQTLAGVNESAAVKASGAASDYKAAMNEQRKAALLGQSWQARSANQTDTQMIMQTGAAVLDSMWPGKTNNGGA